MMDFSHGRTCSRLIHLERDELTCGLFNFFVVLRYIIVKVEEIVELEENFHLETV